MKKDFWKDPVFWVGLVELAVAISQFITDHPRISISAAVVGVGTLIINFLRPLTAPNTPAGSRGNWFQQAYWWLWFHTEFWIANKLKRRPWTYMMRDFWAQHKIWGTLIFLAVTGLITWGVVFNLWVLIIFAFHWMLFAHLWWGSSYIPGEQEDPPYLG